MNALLIERMDPQEIGRWVIERLDAHRPFTFWGEDSGEVVNSIINQLRKLSRDESGGEVLEYALIAGLIVVACIAVIGKVGTKVVARWNSVNQSM